MFPEKYLTILANQVQKANQLTSALAASERRVADNANRGVKQQYTMSQSISFLESTQVERQISFLVPEKHGVYVDRIAIYPSFKFFTTDEATNGPSEVSARPCVFTSGEHVFDPRIELDNAAVDLRVSIGEIFMGNKGERISRDLQNGPIPSKLFYSDSKNYRRNNGGAYSSFDHGKGLYLVRPWFLPAGSAVTFKISPTFASVREDPAIGGFDETKKNTYSVMVVLDGYKRDNA